MTTDPQRSLFFESPPTANMKPDYFLPDYVGPDTPLSLIVPLLANTFSPYLEKSWSCQAQLKATYLLSLPHAIPCRIDLFFHIYWPLLPYLLVCRCVRLDPTLDSELLESSELCHLFLEPQCLIHCWAEQLLNRYLLIEQNLWQNQFFSSSWIVI